MEDLSQLPASIAIAGAWGYIGRKFLDAALALGIRTSVFDPGQPPDDVDMDRVTRILEEESFYRLPVEMFHLALHPEDRHNAVDLLLQRGRQEPLLILCEKPMAAPDRPEECHRLVDATRRLQAVVLYDFPELFDSMTRRIEDYLAGFDEVQIAEIVVSRSKDREDPANPRNYKRIVPIQYQESVHSIAFALSLLGKVRGSLQAVLDEGISVRAEAEPYHPPNPEDYPHVVDGRCRYLISLGATRLRGHTDFKSGAEWTKRRLIWGTADGRPVRIEAEYLEGHKRLVIDGVDQQFDPAADSYKQVLLTANRWKKEIGRRLLMTEVAPSPRFAQLTYQLSSVLWRSARDGTTIRLASMRELDEFDAGFREAIPRFPRYSR
jgi:predicted dehydrogenase